MTWLAQRHKNILRINAAVGQQNDVEDFWIFRIGAPRRDLPPDCGNWKNTHRRFCRWGNKGIGENLLETLPEEAEFN